MSGYRLMEKAYKQGKVRAIGLSNFNPAQIQEILDICEIKPAILQTELHPYAQEIELKAFLEKEHIAIQACTLWDMAIRRCCRMLFLKKWVKSMESVRLRLFCAGIFSLVIL